MQTERIFPYLGVDTSRSITKEESEKLRARKLISGAERGPLKPLSPMDVAKFVQRGLMTFPGAKKPAHHTTGKLDPLRPSASASAERDRLLKRIEHQKSANN